MVAEKKVEKKQKIDDETVDIELARFCEAMDIDLKEDEADDEEKQHIADIKKAISTNSLTVDDDGEMAFTPVRSENKKPIRFYEPTGRTIAAVDRRKEGEKVAQGLAVLAELTKESPKRFYDMKKKDLDVCLQVMGLFLA